MTRAASGKPRVERMAKLEWVPIPLMRVSPLAQRDLNQGRIDKIVAEFDLEQIGTMTVNQRDGWWYVIDGQHRIEVLKAIGWGDQQVQCWAYRGLTEEEEAEKFLKLNDVLTVSAFAKFRIGVQAGRPEECEISKIVHNAGLHVSQASAHGAVACVGTLRRVHQRGPDCLARTLAIVNHAFGDPGLESLVIDGVGLIVARYNGDLDDARAISALSKSSASLKNLLGKAEILHQQTHAPKAHCVAAAAVEMVNAGRGGKKLPTWWKSGQGR